MIHNFLKFNYIYCISLTFSVFLQRKQCNSIQCKCHNPFRSTSSLTPILTRSFLDVRDSVPDFPYSAWMNGAWSSMRTLRQAAPKLCGSCRGPFWEITHTDTPKIGLLWVKSSAATSLPEPKSQVLFAHTCD